MTDAAVKPSSGVGIQTFGSTANQLIPITNISTLTYPIMDSLIDDITYSTDTTNNLQLAMDNVITAFSIRNQPKRQKFHIVIMTANPTSTDNFYDIVDICSKATQIKQQSYYYYYPLILLINILSMFFLMFSMCRYSELCNYHRIGLCSF